VRWGRIKVGRNTIKFPPTLPDEIIKINQYPKALKESIVVRMLPPNNVSVPELTKETRIPKDTLYAWRSKARRGSIPAESKTQGAFSSEEKFNIVLEASNLNEVEIGEYCRRKGIFFYLYLIMDIFSRPSVSDDNPYSEALFKTLKYHPAFPGNPFNNLDEARTWVVGFQHWYNEVHRHSALELVTPSQRHRGEDIVILEKRHRLYEAAKARLPGRWSGKTRNWIPVELVYLNPGKPAKKEVELKEKAA
jgi:transposase-like protein